MAEKAHEQQLDRLENRVVDSTRSVGGDTYSNRGRSRVMGRTLSSSEYG